MRVDVPGAADMLGTFFLANAAELKRLTKATWRCTGRGHVLGHTLALESGEAYLEIKDNPHPDFKSPPLGAVTVEDLQQLTFEQFVSVVESRQVTWDDVMALRTGRKWYALFWPEEIDMLYLSCPCRTAELPLSTVQKPGRKIMVTLS